METVKEKKQIFAICGKGGVGKTVLAALMARALLEAGRKPLLLIDADPAGGLVSAIGEKVENTLAGVRDSLIASARAAGEDEKTQLAQKLDYMLLESLAERSGYSLLAMGRSSKKGCFCPANVLLRDAIDALADAFACVLIDAEAGLEQINRQVTRRMSLAIAVTDGSRRGMDTLESIAGMAGGARVCAVANRVSDAANLQWPPGVEPLGAIPEDETLRRFDREGRSLWELPPDNPAFVAVRDVVLTQETLKTQ